MYELRILNGLHRGATLPLDGRPHVIGASEDADVVLVDPGIETQHASLTLTELGWSLSALDGDVLSSEDNRQHASLNLMPGDFARIGQIWLTVVEQDARWQNPPPEPTDIPVEELAGEQADEYDAHTEALIDEQGEDALTDTSAAAAAEGDELYSDSPLDGPMYEQEAQAAPDPVPAMAQQAATRRRGKFDWRRSRVILVPLATVTVLSACAAYAMTAKTEDDTTFKKPDIHADIKSTGKGDKASGVTALAAKKKAGLSQHELREAFRNRLKEVDLLKRFDLKLSDNSWSMQASLDDDEAARFERILAGFVSAHNITFPINAKVGSAEAMLPFEIRQVISGANASVVTHDGNRLYIGDEYRGVRLVAINGNNLQFNGKRKIEVKW